MKWRPSRWNGAVNGCCWFSGLHEDGVVVDRRGRYTGVSLKGYVEKMVAFGDIYSQLTRTEAEGGSPLHPWTEGCSYLEVERMAFYEPTR